MASKSVVQGLLGIGGILGLINGFVDFTGKPIIAYLLNMGPLFDFTIMAILGIIGIIGGLLVLYFGFAKPNKMYALVGSILAIIGICGLAILALIGALLMEEGS